MIGSGYQDDEMMSEINVTPLVDVMLVLLIVFMVTAPLLAAQSLDVQLPKTSLLKSSSPGNAMRLVLPVMGEVSVDGQPLPDKDLVQFLASRATSPEARIRLEADASVNYGRLAEVMILIQSAGIAKVSFATLGVRSDHQEH